jgi:TRAP-type C4-dicarboxylate transport system permease small subunit
MGLRQRIFVLGKLGEAVGVFGLWVMLGTTLWDVIGAKVFKSPLSGATELVSFAQLLAVGAGMGMTLLLGCHIHVEYALHLLPHPLRGLLSATGQLLIAAFFATIALYTWRFAQGLVLSGEVLPGLRVPVYPFVYAFWGLLVLNSLYGFYLFLEGLLKIRERQ